MVSYLARDESPTNWLSFLFYFISCALQQAAHIIPILFAVKKTPQQNGAVERMNRTLMEHERCMRIHAGLPESFWAETVNHTAYLVNRSPSRNLEFKCAEEVWSNKSIDYSNLKVFGCSAYALIPSDERSKLKPKSLECIFIGFESGVKGYKLWDPVNHKKILSRDVVFDEKTIPMNKVKNSEENEDVVEKETTIEVPLKKVSRKISRKQPTEDVQEEVESDIEEEEARQLLLRFSCTKMDSAASSTCDTRKCTSRLVI